MAEISRRAWLAGALALGSIGAGAVLAGTRSVHHKVAVAPAPPPAELTDALARQRTLLAGYDMLVPGGPAYLNALRGDVQEHGAALLALLERYPGWRLAQARPSGSAAPRGSVPSASAPSRPTATGGSTTAGGTPAPGRSSSPPPRSVLALAEASTAAAAALHSACLDWPAGEPNAAEVLPMLGSISASLSTHVQILTGAGR